MDFIQIGFPILSTMISVKHFAMVTGEAFASNKSKLPYPKHKYKVLDAEAIESDGEADYKKDFHKEYDFNQRV